jgi:hypothetical protein
VSAKVVHGHVHELRPDIFEYLHPRKMYVAGAGSFGAIAEDRPPSTPRLYNVLEVWRDHSRIRVHSRGRPREDGQWEGVYICPDPKDPKKKLPYYDIEFRMPGAEC